MTHRAPALLTVVVLLSACAHGRSGLEAAVAGSVEHGLASWYGDPYHGRRTASGEVYDMYQLTAAHRTLPFGTRVRVTRRDTGASVEVRINDRGPFIRGRIIDLSYAAAREISLVVDGVAPVEVRVVGRDRSHPGHVATEPAQPSNRDCFWVQVGAYASEENAEQNRDRLLAAGEQALIIEGPRGLSRVRVGPFDSRSDASQARRRVLRDWPEAQVVACGG